MKLWYDKPARFWHEALPIGNGRMGGMVHGGQEGISFATALCAKAVGGFVRIIGEHLIMRDVREAYLYLDIETSFREVDYRKVCLNRIRAAAVKDEADIRAVHKEDFGSVFNRLVLSFELTDADLEWIPTDESLRRVQAGERDIGLMELYFQYGRYLLMSSSRKGSLPTNLQGIWEHYLYTGDAVFLREHFDVLEHCVTFFYDFLIEDEEGNLVTSPSLSPENTYERSDD